LSVRSHVHGRLKQRIIRAMKIRAAFILTVAVIALAGCAQTVDEQAWKNCFDQAQQDGIAAGSSRSKAASDASVECRNQLEDQGVGAFNQGWKDKIVPQAPAPTREPEATQGSRENPFAIGDVVTITEGGNPAWDVTIGVPTRDATGLLLEENQFNDVPPAGSEWVLVAVTVTRLSEEPSTPWLEFQFAFVSDSGVTYEETSGVIPYGFRDIADLYEGGSASGNVGFIVPSSELSGGTWRVTVGYDYDFFFANTPKAG
jgi:hypothetical protein